MEMTKTSARNPEGARHCERVHPGPARRRAGGLALAEGGKQNPGSGRWFTSFPWARAEGPPQGIACGVPSEECGLRMDLELQRTAVTLKN